MAKAFLLDMDGVMIDSEIIFLQKQVDFLATKGHKVTQKDVMWQIGLSNAEMAEETIRRYQLGISCEECEAEFHAFFGNQYLEAANLAPVEGLVHFLKTVRANGIKTAVVSSTHCYGILCVLNRFGLVSLFDAVVSGDFVTHRKPHPEPYLKAAGLLKLDPQDCVVIEDSPVGIASGCAAGMHVVALTAGQVQQDVSGAHEVLGSFAAIEKAFSPVGRR